MDTSALRRDGPLTPSMIPATNDNEKPMHREESDSRIDRLTEEINILRLEGAVFCLDPREAKRRSGMLTRTVTIRSADKTLTLPVTIDIHPTYGQPSVLAYKVLQAIFLKMTEEGYPYPNTVSFTQRELARLVGRNSWGGNDGRQIYDAVMQLHRTNIQCSLLDKETKEFVEANFYIVPEALFTGKKTGRAKNITACVVQIHERIVHSLNKHHVAHFNLHDLDTLETLGVVLYKRVFFHFSNRWHPIKKKKEDLQYEKDYADLCREWLGGLKPEKYASRILSNQLGRHLDALKFVGLLRRYSIDRKADGNGFKIVFYPGSSFFENYENFYRAQLQPKMQFKHSWAAREIQQPLELVARFHRELGHPAGNVYLDSETEYARMLLSSLTFADACDLIAYGIERAKDTGFDKKMETFNALKMYLGRWQSARSTREMRRKRQEGMNTCPLGCKAQSGMLTVKDKSGSFRMIECPHDAEALAAFEARSGLTHV